MQAQKSLINVLGLDFETQSLDTATTNATEVGAMLIQVPLRRGFNTPDNWQGLPYWKIAGINQLMWETSYPPQPEEIVELTGITDAMLQKDGIHPKEALERLAELMGKADIVMAHNAPFDKGVLYAVAARYGVTLPEKDWICTRGDINYPSKYTCKKLAHLSLDHGLKMDGRELHRAINDVELMLELVFTNYDLEDVVQYAREPWVYLYADILPPWKDGGMGKAAAQKLGYNWQVPRGDYGPTFEGKWVKKTKANKIEQEKELAGFRVGIVQA